MAHPELHCYPPRGRSVQQASRRRMRSAFSFSAALMLSFATAALAQGPKLKDVGQCNALENQTPAEQIVGCTAVIESAGNSPEVLAVAYNNRGNAYIKSGAIDSAIRDLDQAIKF